MKILGIGNAIVDVICKVENFIDQIDTEQRVSRVYFTQLPSDLNTYEINDKKKIFISIMLPLLLTGNEKVSIERSNLITFFTTQKEIF